MGLATCLAQHRLISGTLGQCIGTQAADGGCLFFSFRAFDWHRTTEIKPYLKIQFSLMLVLMLFASGIPVIIVWPYLIILSTLVRSGRCPAAEVQHLTVLEILAPPMPCRLRKAIGPSGYFYFSSSNISHQRPQKPSRDGKAMPVR
jgi:hypothetical protein